ncbi:MAG TPA: GreA/GreB family elongation factor [Vicinamibacteria bacterium]|nr:GreA/GreB family elongation factor [Vicinamibacteria bacterium]HRB11557.1 GreA/GreB family elongation factor [Vicinamibacteria bacterium]
MQQQQAIRVTDLDSRRLQGLIRGSQVVDTLDASSVDGLERHLDEAVVTPASHIGPDVVTMSSEVQVTDLDSGETFAFHLVFPHLADASAGKVSVLAPLGMAVLGRSVGELVSWQVPAGVRRLRVDNVLYQPEREGRDIA